MTATTTDPFKKTIEAHLQEIAQNDKLFAETLKKPNKNIDSCINYIYSEVKKANRIGWKDDEVFNMAIHYYDEDSIKDVPTAPKPQVKQTPEPKKEASKKAVSIPAQQQKASKKETVKVFVQPSLFD